MIDPESLEGFGGDLMEFMRWMLEEDNVWSFAVDGGELLAVEEAHDELRQLPVTAD